MTSIFPKICGLFIVLFFILGEFVFPDALAGVHLNAVYGLELLLVFVALITFWKRITFRFKPGLPQLIDAVTLFIAGFLVNKLCIPLELKSPINLNNGLVLFFLLIYAPLVEELIFRMAIWQSIRAWIKQPWVLIIATSALFSFSHFYAYFTIEDEFKNFVLYQTGYTFGLALYLGYRLKQGKALFFTMLLHFFFNLGFAIAG
jgi:membrane protease YdiL (CAAX protease family)